MQRLTIEELDYQPDSTPLFARLLDLDYAILLDSAAPYSSRGRYDIMAAQPLTFLREDNVTRKGNYLGISNSYKHNLNLFDTLKQAIEHYTPSLTNDYHLPFIGGAMGLFSYDLARQLECLPTTAQQDITLPDAVIGIYSWAVIVDHRQQRTLLVAHPQTEPAMVREILGRLKCQEHQPALENFSLQGEFASNMSKEAYQQSFQRIKHYINAGDCYQINLAQRFSASYQGSPWDAYSKLRAVAGAHFSAYMQLGQQSVLSLSPERFLHVGNRRVTTSPIKGTIARGTDTQTDNRLAQQLLNSSKDKAENLMIVDLLRNDLGKACIPGSIQVDQLFELQSFETVHHLVSTITGQLEEDKTAIDLLRGCFPGGSITGAPKVRAMEIIEELEPHRRTAYCGSLGYISCDGQMDTNIAIRTMVCDQQKIYCWAGGGIVADSDCDAEYQECFTKVGKLLSALGN